jgi:hypothetical protein
MSLNSLANVVNGPTVTTMNKCVREFSCSHDFQLASFSDKLSAEASRVSPYVDHSIHGLESSVSNSMAISDVMDDEACRGKVHMGASRDEYEGRVKRYKGTQALGAGTNAKVRHCRWEHLERVDPKFGVHTR